MDYFLPGLDPLVETVPGRFPRVGKDSGDTIKLSVGVVARNEESGIAPALESILNQTVFCNAAGLGFEVELIVIANGCTDRTVEVTESFFEKARREFPENGAVRLRLEIVPEAGFANAWNLLAHTFSRADADFIYFVNADIVIDQVEAFEWMLHELQKDIRIQVISPVGRKHIEAAKCKTFCDRLNLMVTRFTEKNQTAQVRGHCFCARATAMRSVWLPKRFPGAVDGCFKRMIISNMASAPDNPVRIGIARNAGYTFEAYRTFQDIFYRRVRLFVGQTFIETLMRHLKTMREEQPTVNPAAYLRARDETDPTWLYRLVQLNIHVNGLYATMPSPWFRFRFLENPKIGRFKKVGMFPVALIAFLFDVPVFLSAAWRLKTGHVSDVWKDIKNKEQSSQ
ncbi:MAG: glycosyltransferase family 2 protein [Verrucomicrobia bacterium]|nr:glycosyltransferase family 2 protein [Verrucomicrobiota bacterium]